MNPSANALPCPNPPFGALRLTRLFGFPVPLVPVSPAPPIFPSSRPAVGNAAQALHPVAGQCLNMSIRDVWELAQVILDCPPEDIDSAVMCAEYRKSCRIDSNGSIGFTDRLVCVFFNNLPLLGQLRPAAHTLSNGIPLATQFVAKRMLSGPNS